MTLAHLLDSPALPLLLELEDQGFDLAIKPDGGLQAKPPNRLTPEQRARIQANRPAVIALVRICDPGVQSRRELFVRLLETAPTGVVVPALLFRAGVPYQRGVCFSCGDAPEARFGRCWRCSLAWRLALKVPIEGEEPGAIRTQVAEQAMNDHPLTVAGLRIAVA